MATDPLNKNFLQDQLAATQSNQTDLSSLDTSTANVIEATKVPDSTAQVSAAQNLASTVNKDVKPVAQAMVSDLQGKISAGERQQTIQAEATQIKKESIQNYVQGARDASVAAVKSQEQFEGQISLDRQASIESKQQMIEQSKQVQAEYNANIEKWANTSDDALVRDLETANFAMHQNSSAMERQIKESDPNWQNSPVYENFKIEQGMAFKASANALISQARQRTQSMLQAGATAGANIATAVTQNISWAHKYALDFQQYATQAVQQTQAQTMAYLDAQRGMKMAGMDDYASWLAQSPVFAIELAPMMATVLDLQQSSQAAADAQAKEKRAEETAASDKKQARSDVTSARFAAISDEENKNLAVQRFARKRGGF